MRGKEKDISKEPQGKATIKKIVKATAKLWGYKSKQLIERNNERSVSFPRHVAMHLAYKHTNKSTIQVAKYFDNRDSSNIFYAMKRVKMECERSQTIANAINELEKMFNKMNRT
tara:strand:- start:2537 stop:2878 length:342 start_codon:yes stop_codon:yes gene_type:complete